MKWSALVAAGFAIAAIGMAVTAIALLLDHPIYGYVITSVGIAIALTGGAKHFAERD